MKTCILFGHLSSRHLLACVAILATILVTAVSTTRAQSSWGNYSGNWSVDGPTGWNAGGVPNTAGATARLIVGISGNRTTTQDVLGGVTVGTIQFGNNNALGNSYWRLANTNGIILDQDSLGIGLATISNSNTTVGTTTALWITTGTLTLADNLQVLNTAGSTNVNGAIQLDSAIDGTGDITFNSNAAISSTNSSSPGAIRISKANTFVGNSLIQRGLVVLNSSATPFGAAGNVVAIGQQGSGSAGLLSRDNLSPYNYDITIAASDIGETRTMGASSNSSYVVSTGNILLNGNVDLRAGNTSTTAIQRYTGNFSGAGGINKTFTAIASLSGTNTYLGRTTVSGGTLHFGQQVSLYNNTHASWTDANIAVNTGTVLALSVGGAGEFNSSDVQTISGLGTGSGGFANGSFLALDTTSGNATVSANISNANSLGLIKSGANILTLDGTNSYSGITTVGAGTLQFAKRVSLYNATPASWTDTNLVVNSGTTAAFNIGGAGEFTLAEVQSNLITLGSATGGFRSGSNIGIDTTNAGANTVYNKVIANPNAGANAIGLVKLGANTLTLDASLNGDYNLDGVVNAADYPVWRDAIGNPAAYATWVANFGNAGGGTNNTYTGRTTVLGGTLDVISSHTTGNTYSVANGGEIIVNAGTAITTSGGFYVGAGGVGTGTSDGVITTNGTGGGTFDSTGNWGFGVGVFAGGNGVFTNTGAGSVDSNTDLRVGDGFGGAATGEFYHDSTGTVNVDDYLTLGHFGGTGKFVKETGSGDVNIDFRLFIGTGGGQGTFTHESGNVTMGIVRQEDLAPNYEELFLGEGLGGDGKYDLQSGTLTVNGWSNLGRDGGTGTFTNAGTFNTTRELRVGAGYDGSVSTGTLHNLAGGVITAGNIFVGIGAQGTGTINHAGASITTVNQITVGDAGIGTLNQSAGSISSGLWLTLGEAGTGIGTYNLSSGSLTTVFNLELGYLGQGNVNQTGGDITVNGETVLGNQISATGTYVLDAGTLTSDGWTYVGLNGLGNFTQNGGAIVTGNQADGPSKAFGVGVAATGSGTFTQNHGSLRVVNDWFVVGVSGMGTADIKNDSTIAANVLAAGQNAGSNGTININNPGGSITLTNIDYSMYPTIVPVPLTGWVYAGMAPGATGTINLMAGTVTNGDWTEIGLEGTGTLNVTGGSLTTGDNFRIGSYTGGTGLMTMSAGTVTVTGNDPAYTGNFIVGDHGSGTFNMSGGALNLTTGNTGTNNSASYSISQATGIGTELDLARDGNFTIAEEEGSGVVDLSGTAVVSVAANVFVGGANFTTFVGGTGTLTIRENAQLLVGQTSPTGGDFILGSPFSSTATVNLQGGLLDVTETDGTGTFGGSIASGGGSSPNLTFNFTGGTLKVREWNTSGPFGGDLGNLVQNGAGSLLDVTGNNTTVLSGYDLGEGTATIGSGRTLTANGVLNGTGAGVINVGQGGATANLTMTGANAVSVDTLNLNNGNVTAGGGVNVDTELTGNGTINGNVIMAAAGDVDPGLSAGQLNLVGDMSFGSSGTLEIEIGGNSTGQFDLVDVTGALNAAGTLNVTLINSFAPVVNSLYKVLDFGSFAGSFTVTSSTGTWDGSLLSTTGQIRFLAAGAGSGTNVPEPASLVLACGAFAMLFVVARRRAV